MAYGAPGPHAREHVDIDPHTLSTLVLPGRMEEAASSPRPTAVEVTQS